MDIQQLEFFCEIAELEHISNAAQRLMVSQPTLSRSVQALEDELGVELFDRNGKRIRLNDYGRYFYHKARQIVSLMHEAKKEISDVKAKKSNHVVIAAMSKGILHGLVNHLQGKYPWLTISGLAIAPEDAMSCLQSFDITFYLSGMLFEDEKIIASDVCMMPIRTILSVEHPLAGLPSIRLHDLEKYGFITFAKGTGPQYIDCLKPYFHNRHPEIGYESYSINNIMAYLKNSEYITLVTQDMLPSHLPAALKVLPITDLQQNALLRLYWGADNHLTREKKQLKNDILDYYRYDKRGGVNGN